MNKIWIVSIFLFFIFCIFTIPFLSNNQVLRANLQLEDVLDFSNQKVYLKNKEGYLVEVDVFMDSKDNISEIFSYLKEDNLDMNSHFSGYIPKNVILLDYYLVDSILYLNLSKEILDSDHFNFILSGIVHTFLKVKSISKVSISIEGNALDGYPAFFDQSFPINVLESIYKRTNISKVVIYYMDSYQDKNYYLPVSKYINDDREKIEIIIEQLKYDIPTSLLSYLDVHTKLLSYDIDHDTMILNFNDSILLDDENFQMISFSVFANYDVSSVVFEVNGKIKKCFSLNA